MFFSKKMKLGDTYTSVIDGKTVEFEIGSNGIPIPKYIPPPPTMKQNIARWEEEGLDIFLLNKKKNKPNKKTQV